MPYALLLVAVLSAYPSSRQQLRLEDEMTMNQVLAILGEPDSTQSRTCGSSTPKPWSCRIWNYTDGARTFTVRFGVFDDKWLVNSWDSY